MSGWLAKVLVVDDDVRNIFALTTVLEQHNVRWSTRRMAAPGSRRC
jgi:hypothetical protein